MLQKLSLSANSLFHFTNSIVKLKSILKNGFYPHYSLETFTRLKITFFPRDKKIYVPMVSFNDLPLSQVKYHTNIYGMYGIGLTKNWGLKNGLNSVFYLSKKSIPFESFIELDTYFMKPANERIFIFSDSYFKIQQNLWKILLFTKPPIGLFEHGGKKHRNYKYYDEREWRYIPLPKKNDVIYFFEIWITKKEKSIYLRPYQRVLINQYKLKFNINDIKYIIVKDEKEIIKVRKIIELKSKLMNDKIINYPKIFTIKNVYDDF